MSKKPEQGSPGAAPQNAPMAKVIPIGSNKCTFDECKAKPARAGFCDEHFTWFKEGLITKEGHRSPDFDKKYQAFARRKKAA